MTTPDTASPSSHRTAGSSQDDPVTQLSPQVLRWIWDQGWEDLHPLQERAIAPVLAGQDVVIAAPTASGKTEAAWLPIFSALGADQPCAPPPNAAPDQEEDPCAPTGIAALYVAPLKALINDTAVANAVEAQKEWAAWNPQRRARVMMKFVDLVNQNIDELAELLSIEHGKTVADSKGDIQRGIEVIEFADRHPAPAQG